MSTVNASKSIAIDWPPDPLKEDTMTTSPEIIELAKAITTAADAHIKAGLLDDVVSIVGNPALWPAIGRELRLAHPGPRYCQYDLSDESEATDVAQLVCEQIIAFTRTGLAAL